MALSGHAKGVRQPEPRATPWVVRWRLESFGLAASPEGALHRSLESEERLMPQSLARVHIHLVYSTKNREALISDEVRPALHRYQAVVLKNVGCPAVLINSVEDHVHALFELSRTVAIATAVEEVKKSSSKWMKTQGVASFAWQAGYGAFGVSESNVDQVRRYIEGQREHHRTMSFQEEYRALLERHRVSFDERYVWD